MRTVPFGNFCCATAVVLTKVNARIANRAFRAGAAIFTASTSVAAPIVVSQASPGNPCASTTAVAFSLALNECAPGEQQMHADAAIPPREPSTAPPAEVVLRNAHIVTVDGRGSIAHAIAI